MGPLDLLDYQPTPRFGREPDINAYVELHNLIAAAESTDEFSRDDLDRIGRQRGLDLSVDFLDERIRLYQILLGVRLENGDLDAEDRALLAHLAHTLALSPADLRPAHERAFGKAVTSAISDDCLDVEERLLLYKLQNLLGLDPIVADGAYGVIARERLLKTVASVLCDGKLSPDEAADVERVRADLSLTLPTRIQEMLDRAAARWADLHAGLNPVHVHAPLLAEETAYYTTDGATWTDVDIGNYRRVFATSDYRDRVAKGQTRSIRMPDVALDGPRLRGRVTVTNRRLILHADGRGVQRINLSSLAAVQLFSNGVTARTGGGWHVFFDLGERSERFHTVLYRLLQPNAVNGDSALDEDQETTVSVPPPASTPSAASPVDPGPETNSVTDPASVGTMYEVARWRRVTPSEVSSARAGASLARGAYDQVLEALEVEGDWAGTGRVQVTDTYIVLKGTPRRTIALSGVAMAVRRDRVVWIPLERGRGWLLEFRDVEDADVLARSVEAHLTRR